MGTSRLKLIHGVIITLAVCGLVVIAATLFTDSLMENAKINRASMLKSAVRRAALTCYAVEGRYPLTLDYLVDNYGLICSDSDFVVVYDAFATNVFPSIDVLTRGAS